MGAGVGEALSGEGGLSGRDRAGFGTGAAFLTTLSTILGAIVLLRLGYSVAHVSTLGTPAIIVLDHLVTVPTSMAIAEIGSAPVADAGSRAAEAERNGRA